jgi:hypothetical protein
VPHFGLPRSQATGIGDEGDVVDFEQSSPSAAASEGFLRANRGEARMAGRGRGPNQNGGQLDD